LASSVSAVPTKTKLFKEIVNLCKVGRHRMVPPLLA